jgi:hypothetical protein
MVRNRFAAPTLNQRLASCRWLPRCPVVIYVRGLRLGWDQSWEHLVAAVAGRCLAGLSAVVVLEVLSRVEVSAGKFISPPHIGMRSDERVRLLMGVIDVG